MVQSTSNLRPLCLAILVAGILVFAACSLPLSNEGNMAVVDLDMREPLPAVGDLEQNPLRVGVGAMLSAETTFDSYTYIAEYLGENLGRTIDIVQRRTYAELNQLIAEGDVDIAFVCTGAYVTGSAEGYMDLLVVPEVDGKTSYHSSLIVPTKSRAQSLEDLRGARFAFTDPMSLTGRVYVTSLLSSRGETPASFFGHTVFTYSHDRAIKAVAAGVVDGASVDHLVLEDLVERNPSIAAGVRVIGQSPEFGIPPVVVPSDTPHVVRERFRQLLLSLTVEPGGRNILDPLGVDRFVDAHDDLYSDVRLLLGDHPVDHD